MSTAPYRPVPTQLLRAMAAACVASLPVGEAAFALTTDISNEPLINRVGSTAVKPNILFILDDSGSMASGAMPDDMNDNGRFGYYSSQCNGVAFDPTQTYTPPVRSDGTIYPEATLAGAWDDGYIKSTGGTSRSVTATALAVGTGSKTVVISTSSSSASSFYTTGQRVQLTSSTDSTVQMVGTVTSWTYSSSARKGTLILNITYSYGTGSLSTGTVANMLDLSGSTYYNYTGSEPKLSWKYTATNYVSNTYSNECLTSLSSGSTKFSAVAVDGSSTAATQQNYANWYSYYRTRRLTMRWAAGKAFSGLGTDFRVGFTTISDRTAVDGNKFLHVRDFEQTQKNSFFSKLYTTTGSSSTPLRGALSKAGRYYAYKVYGQDADPVQYSCQRHFSILSTDGYWNTGLEKTDGDSTNNYGPYKLDNTTLVGQQDSSATEERPRQDGQKTVVTKTTTYSYKESRIVTTPMTTKTNVFRTFYEATSASTSSSSSSSGATAACTAGRIKTRSYQQKATRTVVDNSAQGQERPATYNGTQVTTDGVAAAETYGSVSYGSWGNVGTASSTNVSNLIGTYATVSGTTTLWSACATGTAAPPPTGVTNETAQSGPTAGTVSNGSASAGPASATSSSSVTTYPGGSTDSLADVAEYYYITALRNKTLSNCSSKLTGADLCANMNLEDGWKQTGEKQRMITYTIGLGVPGTLSFPGDEDALAGKQGVTVKDWPIPSADEATAIDDLWHAAVNGRGKYFSALNASQLASALSGALTSVQEQSASGAAAATSSTQLLNGVNNYKFKAEYKTVSWVGDVKAYLVDAATGEASDTAVWSAQAKLATVSADLRKIYYFSTSASGKAQAFTYANLKADSLNARFDDFCSTTKVVIPKQCDDMSDANKAIANNGANLVDWLRGSNAREGATGVYRTRTSKLGDIIGGEPVSVAAPPFSYADDGYATFAKDNKSRKPMAYAASNDGMLHAFSAAEDDGGAEVWAYVPRAVMANMYKLADTAYANRHIYLVDGAPNFGDIYGGGAWRTIVVGGLGGGGRSYYALDVTDPLNPKALWEITNETTGFANLGYTFGNPVITKIGGRWVVAFASGHNNVDANADGQGYLYVVDAYTGEKIAQAATGKGSNTEPAGLSKINAWVEKETDNTADRFYAGDLWGYLWRFNFTAGSQTGEAIKLAEFAVRTSSGDTVRQPVTTRVEPLLVTYNKNTYPVVIVGTGRYLGVSDLSDTSLQSLYAIKDPGTSTGWGSARTHADIVVQKITNGVDLNGDGDTADANEGTQKAGTSNPVDWASKIGWMIDLPDKSERVITKMIHQFNTLVVPTAVPVGDACSSSGSSNLYYLNVNSGSPLQSGGIVGSQFSKDSIIVGITWIQTVATKNTKGEPVPPKSKLIVQDSKGRDVELDPPGRSNSSDGTEGTIGNLRRTSWRELVN